MGFHLDGSSNKGSFQQHLHLYNQARDQIFGREITRLGEAEFQRRLDAVANHQLGRAGPSGYEDWQRELDTGLDWRAGSIKSRCHARSTNFHFHYNLGCSRRFLYASAQGALECGIRVAREVNE
jgi:hypothetical protein